MRGMRAACEGAEGDVAAGQRGGYIILRLTSRTLWKRLHLKGLWMRSVQILPACHHIKPTDTSSCMTVFTWHNLSLPRQADLCPPET